MCDGPGPDCRDDIVNDLLRQSGRRPDTTPELADKALKVFDQIHQAMGRAPLWPDVYSWPLGVKLNYVGMFPGTRCYSVEVKIDLTECVQVRCHEVDALDLDNSYVEKKTAFMTGGPVPGAVIEMFRPMVELEVERSKARDDAEFELEPVTYGWTESGYAAREAVREFNESVTGELPC